MMASSTSKKVVVYRFDRQELTGFVNPQSWLGVAGIDMLTPDGNVMLIPYAEIKAVCFVREFDGDSWRSERKLFASRPKSEGLWVRATFLDNDFFDGMIPNNLAGGDAQGFQVVPPDPASNSQHVFLPRTALKDLKVMGVIGSPASRRGTKPSEAGQARLFD